MSASTPVLLDVQNVSKSFGGLHALNKVTFQINPGEIFGLIGPNGAGKTTMFNIVNGVYAPISGHIFFQGKEITGMPPNRVAKRGIARTHQIVRPLQELTVKENVMAGACFGRENLSLTAASKVADEVLEFVGLADKQDILAGKLNVAQKKRLEMARALAARPILLLLDEVLAGLNPNEVDGMIAVIHKIRAQGVTVLMIEHLMRAVMNLSDRIVVLDYGSKIAEGTPAEVSSNPRVIAAYLGDPQVAQRFLEGTA